MDSARVMTALRNRRWMIAAAVLGCTAATAVSSQRAKREYQASATLMPQEVALEPLRRMQQSPDTRDEGDDPVVSEDRMKTVAAVVTSPTVLSQVIANLHLPTTTTMLGERVQTKPLSMQLLRVSVTDEDPQRASATVNGIVKTFVSYYGSLRAQEARKQLASLQGERKGAERELLLASSRLERFKRDGGFTDLDTQQKEAITRYAQVEGDRNTTAAQLRETTAQLGTAQAILARTPATREVKTQETQSELLGKLRLDVADLQAQLDKAMGVYTDEHPTVVRLKAQLAEAKQHLDSERSRLATSVKVIPNPDRETAAAAVRDLTQKRDGLQARLSSMERDLGQARGRVAALPGKDVQLALLSQRYKLAEDRLAGVTGQLGQLENAVAKLGSGPAIAVVDTAGPHNPPLDLSQGRTIRLTALAFVLSLACCVALAIGLEMADRRIRSVEDVEDLMRLPVVSVVPRLGGRTNSGRLCLTAENDPASHLAESYHFLANHILRQTMRRENTVLMGATGRPGQGATTALSNLAIALARAGRQVVLVEADLRRPYLHEVFERQGKPGLTDVLEDRAGLVEALAPTHVDNLRLLPAGSTVVDPWSLLWQPGMATLVDQLRAAADYVIFNVPSATVFGDAMCIAPHVDGAILVVRNTETPSGAENKVREWLDEVNVPVMGVVLNGVPRREMDTFDFHRSYTARRADQPERALPGPSAPPVRRPA